ncbi:MAG: protein kinase [Nocardioides sp.]
MTESPGSPTFADDAGRFRLDSRIATGGMGEVWRATDTTLGRTVAVKLLKAEFADDPVFRQRFETEARHAAALHHPGIAAVFDVGERTAADGSAHPRPFLVMELVEGEPLSQLLRAGRDLDPVAVRDLMAQVGEALGAAHAAGIIHRDVKPANLIVTPQGQVKVTDFGIARAADGVGITRTGAVMGTPQYLSPEQAEGKPSSTASDVYSLGVVTFECLTGRRPFEADSPVATALAHIREPVPDLPDTIPADLAAVVRRALAKDPAERFADGAEFAAALRDPARAEAAPVAPVVPVPVTDAAATQVLAATPAAAEPAPLTAAPGPLPTTTDSRRNPWPIIAIVTLLVAVGVVLTLLLTGNDADPAADETNAVTTPARTPSSSAPTEPSSEPPSEPSSEEPETVDVNADDYSGRPFADVAADLRSLGLRVAEDVRTNTDPDQDGLVITVDPQGEQPANTLITVTYWGEAPVEIETPTEEPTTSEPPTTQPPATQPPATQPSATQPSATQPTPTRPPATQAPATQRPSTRPTISRDPIDQGDQS